jgi:hypothetical protein
VSVRGFAGLSQQQQTGLTAGLVVGIGSSILVVVAVSWYKQRKQDKAKQVNTTSPGSHQLNSGTVVHTAVPISATNFTASNTYWNRNHTAPAGGDDAMRT